MAMRQAIERTASTWWIALIEGIVVLIAGLLLLFAPGMATLIFLQILGLYWLVSGLLAIVEIFAGNRRTPWGWLLFYGIIGILAGLAVLRHPLLSAVLIPTLLVVYLGIGGIILGIVDLIRGLSGRAGWTIVLGVLNILIGIFLLFHPFASALALLIVIGILAAITGVILIASAIQMRNQEISPRGMPIG